MCRLSEAELNCVNTNILVIPEFRQFDMGISTSRYFPAMGTAGFDRLAVNGYNLVPAPPPNMTDKISLDIYKRFNELNDAFSLPKIIPIKFLFYTINIVTIKSQSFIDSYNWRYDRTLDSQLKSSCMICRRISFIFSGCWNNSTALQMPWVISPTVT